MPSQNPDLTPILEFPSPKPADPPDVPGDVKALAQKVEQVLTTAAPVSASFGSSLSLPLQDGWQPVPGGTRLKITSTRQARVLMFASGGVKTGGASMEVRLTWPGESVNAVGLPPVRVDPLPRADDEGTFPFTCVGVADVTKGQTLDVGIAARKYPGTSGTASFYSVNITAVELF